MATKALPPIDLIRWGEGLARVRDGGGVGGVAADMGVLVGDGTVQRGTAIAAVGIGFVFGTDAIGAAPGQAEGEHEEYGGNDPDH